MRILISIFALCLVSSGCDRIAYEAKNNKVTQSVISTYKNVNRIPLEGQLTACREKYPWPKYAFTEDLVKCMEQGGWRWNPEVNVAIEKCLRETPDEKNRNCGNVTGIQEWLPL